MNYTPKEIELCRRLHELGVRQEIREGDYIDKKNSPGEIGLVLWDSLSFYNDPIYRDNFILLFSWERAREWLRERGWKLTGHNEHPKEITCSFYNEKSLRDEFGRGQTDLEAILAAMVQVAEGEKYE